jgi:hypothetical protein
MLITLAATTVIGLSGPGNANEPVLLNCRLMTESTPWLFRQHCKSENFARLEVYKKKHALLEKKKYLKQKLYWKIRYLEKKLYAELRECKSYKCKLILKTKLAKLYNDPSSYSTMSPSGYASAGSTLGTTTGALSATTNSLGSAAGNTVSGATDTVGGAVQSAGGVVSGATNTVGGFTESADRSLSGATDTVGGLLK